jgi:fructose/tagatose bisphosphate aldolase
MLSASFIFDASMLPIEENQRRTADYVARNRKRVVIEGCPDKVYERDELLELERQGHTSLSKAKEIADYVSSTGVDLIVPNLGTEHRTSQRHHSPAQPLTPSFIAPTL